MIVSLLTFLIFIRKADNPWIAVLTTSLAFTLIATPITVMLSHDLNVTQFMMMTMNDQYQRGLAHLFLVNGLTHMILVSIYLCIVLAYRKFKSK